MTQADRVQCTMQGTSEEELRSHNRLVSSSSSSLVWTIRKTACTQEANLVVLHTCKHANVPRSLTIRVSHNMYLVGADVAPIAAL